MVIQKYGVTPNTITAVTNLNIKFVISCYGFRLYFTMVETKNCRCCHWKLYVKKGQIGRYVQLHLKVLCQWFRVLVEKLTVQLGKKIHEFCENNKYITMVTTVKPLSLFPATLIQPGTFLSVSFKMHFNIILLSAPSSSKQSLSFWFPHQNDTCSFSPPYVPH